MASESKAHFILVHGACHGAWCWYKVAGSLRASGHRVTVPDLGASGIDERRIDELHTAFDYVQPLLEIMESLPPEEKVVLVGHSSGGLVISIAMEKFPAKISAAVFLTAFMPRPGSPPLHVLEKFFLVTPAESLLDCKMFLEGPGPTPELMKFGPNFLSAKMYQCCSNEDLTLAIMLMRWTKFFKDDLSHESMISKENYGSISRIYIISKEDEAITKCLQNWMIENNPVKEVKEIEGGDHMPMLSKPQDLCLYLLEIAKKYS